MKSSRPFLILVVLLAVSLWADNKKKQAYYLKADQTADLEAPKLVTARQNCENWSLAAGLEGMLARQNAGISQNYWIMRLYGGELCVPEIPSLDALAREVNREFVLDDGRHVRLELRFVPGAPTNIDSLIYTLKKQELQILLLRGHAYYITGASYDERIGRDGGRMFIVKELRLANTYAKEPGIAFENGRDNVEEIQGVVSVTVTPITSQKW